MTDHLNHASDFIFDNNNQERPPWKICGRTCSRTVFFVNISVLSCISTASVFNYLIFARTCDERTVWIAILSSAVGYILPNPRT